MRTELSFVLLVAMLFSEAVSQPQDSVDTAVLNSLNSFEKGQTSDTLSVEPHRRSTGGDEFRDELLNRFSRGEEISSEDIDDFIGESVGDLLEMKSWIDVVRVGSWGQPERGLVSGNVRGISLFVDGHSFQQQDLYFPQRGELDLNSVPLSNVSKVEFLPVGLASLWGNGRGILGIDVTTKDFDMIEPYSRVTASRGPFGFHRTQVELGRGLTSKGRFYLTGEFKESDGYLSNSDYDGVSGSGRTTFSLKRGMNLRLSGYQYKTEMGVAPLLDANFHDVRKKANHWGATGSVLLEASENSVLNLSLRYKRRNQELKSISYDFEGKKIEELVGLTATQSLKLECSHHFRIKGHTERKSLKALEAKRAVFAGYLSVADLIEIDPKMRLLLCLRVGKEEGLEPDASACGGIAYQITQDLKVFSTLARSVGYPTLMDRFWRPFSLSFKDTITDYAEEGNGSIKSQKSFAADLGGSIQKERYRIGAYVFGCRVDDFVFWSNVDTSLCYGHYKPVNAAAEIWGACLDAEFEVFDHLSSYVSYSFKQGRNSDRRMRLPHSADHSLFGYFQLEDGFLRGEMGLKLRLETTILSERYMDEYEQDKEPGVVVLNAKITVRFLDFHFHYVVRNITDQTYRLTGDYPMPERSFWWGFYWEFFD